MIIRLIVLTLVLVSLAQIPGCHFYIDGAPRIIIASEPIHAD